LIKARHPLLERTLRAKGGHVVPVSIELEGERLELVITGPNTGGKTVALKTVGLLALMAQSGIPVPADRAELQVFDAVLADIGDYQSIEQNLSTFSAHVTNIDFISRTATANSLVLLDELGSATDPEEGAALAVAIAEHFRRVGCVTVISTHHTSLKVFGANTPGVVNSSVGFDEATLQPTYELKIGVPGASAGINIAQRLGLNPSIIEAARSKLGTQARDVGQFLDSLHANLREAETERLRLKARKKELDREKATLAAEGRKEQQAKIKEMETKLETLLRDFEYQAREMVNAVQDRTASQKLSKDAERRISRLRREFSEQFDSTVVAHTTGADRGDPNAQPQVVKHVSEGDTVKLKSVGRPGVVSRKLDENHFEVEIGAMKMVPRRHAEYCRGRLIRQSPRGQISVFGVQMQACRQRSMSSAASVDDATREVENLWTRFRPVWHGCVVHRQRMGILRKALRQYFCISARGIG
jgi:DNA mismatch repair protein MutS2